MFVNWLLEAYKFKFLLKNISKITIYQSFKAVFAGVTASIFTPKRIGDFAGRIFILQPEHRVQGTFATLIGSLSQLIVTVTSGLFLLLFYKNNITNNDFFSNTFIYVITIVIDIFLIIIYLNIDKLEWLLYKFSFFRKYSEFINFIKKYRTDDLLLVLFVGFLRYAVFTLQFYILLIIFDVDISYFMAITAIGVIYLITTGIPTVALGELSIRGSVAVMVFEPFTQGIFGVVEASVLLWFINLAIPALFGAYFLALNKKTKI